MPHYLSESLANSSINILSILTFCHTYFRYLVQQDAECNYDHIINDYGTDRKMSKHLKEEIMILNKEKTEVTEQLNVVSMKTFLIKYLAFCCN